MIVLILCLLLGAPVFAEAAPSEAQLFSEAESRYLGKNYAAALEAYDGLSARFSALRARAGRAVQACCLPVQARALAGSGFPPRRDREEVPLDPVHRLRPVLEGPFPVPPAELVAVRGLARRVPVRRKGCRAHAPGAAAQVPRPGRPGKRGRGPPLPAVSPGRVPVLEPRRDRSGDAGVAPAEGRPARGARRARLPLRPRRLPAAVGRQVSPPAGGVPARGRQGSRGRGAVPTARIRGRTMSRWWPTGGFSPPRRASPTFGRCRA